MDGTIWLCVCCVCVHASYPNIDIRASCHHTVSLRSLSVQGHNQHTMLQDCH